MKIGDKAYIVATDSRRNHEVKLIEVNITKIGNKYIELKENFYGKFDKITLMQFNDKYSSRYKMYLSKEAYLEELEFNKRVTEIRNYFGSYGNEFKVDTINKIHELIFNNEKNQ